ncbi:MAG: signal peptidase I [Flavobacteriaceae bacterium]|nr:signal peptidase I [Flavobacteriaceae bacterium]
MSHLQFWSIVFVVSNLLHFLGTWKIYKQAGKNPLMALVPVYNAILIFEIIGKPKWWTLLLFVPVINLFIFPVIWIELAKGFGKDGPKYSWLSVLSLGLYVVYLNYDNKSEYIKDRTRVEKSEFAKWVDSIVFAVVAATIVHSYFIQPYVIPTSSLEKTLLVGDFLFVSKYHYGARTPISPIAAPMVHDSIPGTGMKSYLNIELPYFRFPGFQKIKRNEIVVFNWPGDTLKTMWGDYSGEFTYKPIDKKTNYVKRCVAIAGDSLHIIDGYIHINGKRSVFNEKAKPQFTYFVKTKKPRSLSLEEIYNRYMVNRGEATYDSRRDVYSFSMDKENADKLRNNPKVKSIERQIVSGGVFDKGVFPHDEQYPWSQDNFGPLYIPKAGVTVELNSKTIPFYKRIIADYEANDLVIMDDDIFINGQQVSSYTFKQDYYWMMGDNRHRSLDARFFGFTPFDHVVGKPILIWMSWDTNGKTLLDKIRWERLFTTVHGQGGLKSYWYYALLFILIVSGINRYFTKKNKDKKA